MKFRCQYTIPLLLLLAPFFIAMAYTFPSGDDFSRANEARTWFDIGQALESMGKSWWTWSGRYTHHFLVIFLGKSAESRFGYMAVCVFVSLLYWVSLWGIFKGVTKGGEKAQAFFISSVCMLTLYSCYPAVRITFYEVTDLLGIAIGNGLVLTFIWSLCSLWNAEVIQARHKWTTISSAVAAIGCYEHSAIAIVLVALTACAMACYTSHRHKKFFITISLVSCAFFLVSFFARGNFRRQTKRDVSLDQILDQLILAFDAWKNFGFSYFASMFLPLSIWVATCVGPYKDTYEEKGTPTRIKPAFYALGCTFIVCLLSAGIIIIHALSDVPIHHGVPKLTASIMLLTTYAVTACCIGLALPLRTLLKKTGKHNLYLLVSGLLFGLLLTQQTGYKETLSSQFSGESAAYAASKEKRNAFLYWQGFSSERGLQTVSREMLSPHPNAVTFAIPEDPKTWPADKAAQMFGVDAVVASLPKVDLAYASVTEDRLREKNAVTFNLKQSPVRVVYQKNITAGPNDTFRFHWLFIDSDKQSINRISTVVIIRRQAEKPMPIALQSYLQKQVRDKKIVAKESMPRMAGIHYSWQPAFWKIPPQISQTSLSPSFDYAIPVAAPEWGRVRAIFISIDDSDYYAVPLI